MLAAGFATFDPAAGFKVDSGMFEEIVRIAPAAPHKQGDAVVPAGYDQGNRSGREPHDSVATQGVAERDGIIALRIDGIERHLQTLPHSDAAHIMQAFRQEFYVHLIGRPGCEKTDLAKQDFTTDDFQAHETCNLNSPRTDRNIPRAAMSSI